MLREPDKIGFLRQVMRTRHSDVTGVYNRSGRFAVIAIKPLTMKKISIAILAMLAMAACKKDKTDPIPEVASIVSKWRPVSYIRAGGDTVSLVGQDVNLLIFRFDGVMLNEKGYKPCCSPDSYMLNGKRFEVKPQAPVEEDPSCIFVDCIKCEDLKMTLLSDDELLIDYCLGTSTKYVREK